MQADPGIIAQRTYYLEDARSPVIELQIWRPHQPDADYPRCRYRLIVRGEIEDHEITGVDAIDCIVLCLAAAGSNIAGLNDAVFDGKLRWDGWSAEGGLGLPTIEESWPADKAYREAMRSSTEEQIRRRDQPPPED